MMSEDKDLGDLSRSRATPRAPTGLGHSASITIAESGPVEQIERAAIWCRGFVYSVPRPGRHHDVIHVMAQDGYGPGDMKHQGFTTSFERFVDRKEAVKIARAAGQIGVKTSPEDMLFSEDLW